MQELKKKILFLIHEYANEFLSPQPFSPGSSFIPASGKVIKEKELSYMVEAVLDGWLTIGRFNTTFEKRLSRFIGVRSALTTNSGSSANLLAFASLTSARLDDRTLQPGDEVITVAAGFPTTINPILLYGMVPVFVDIHIPTYNIDIEKIEQAITNRTKAIMLAHTLGNPFNLDVVTALAKQYKLWLIEDCCDALGSMYRERMVGTFGDIGTLSFYPAHHITMGEGGAIFTNKPLLKSILESLRDWGRDCYCMPGKDNTCSKRFEWQLGNLPFGYDHKYIYSHLGYNLKITDIQAACGLAQLERVEDFIALRKINFSYLKNQLKPMEEFFMLPEATPYSDPSWFGFPITLRDGAPFERVELLRYLDTCNVGTRLLFAGNLINQPYMMTKRYRVFDSLENTNNVMNNTFWLGVHPGLSTEMLDYVVHCIHSFVYLGIRANKEIKLIKKSSD